MAGEVASRTDHTIRLGTAASMSSSFPRPWSSKPGVQLQSRLHHHSDPHSITLLSITLSHPSSLHARLCRAEDDIPEA